MRVGLVCVIALIGCGAPPPPAAPPPVVRAQKPPPPAPPAPLPSRFHVIGWSEHFSDKTANPTTLCAIEGAVFVCGTDHVVRLEGDDLIRDELLETGLLRDEKGALKGRINQMLGKFPTDAWLVMRTGVSIGTSALYKRTAKEWALAKKWKIESVAGSVEYLKWKPGKIAVLAHSLTGNDRATVEVVTKVSASPMPALPNASACPQWLRAPHLAVAKDGSLVVTGTRCDGDTPAWVKLGTTAEKRDGAPDYSTVPTSEYFIVSSTLHRRLAGDAEELTMPAPPVKDGSTLVPFQVVVRGKDDVIVAARFQNEKMTGVAILRTAPAKNPAKL